MKYDDEQILTLQDYEIMAKAYANALKSKGFIFVQVDDEQFKEVVEETFDYFAQAKSCLLILGGFLNTSPIYSLNERQLKKLRVIFDYEKPLKSYKFRYDKTYCFLKFLGLEVRILKNLIYLKDKSNFENELNKLIEDRLITLSNVFSVY